MSRLNNSSRACQWVAPRPYTDASLRYMKHGPILPLSADERTLVRDNVKWFPLVLVVVGVVLLGIAVVGR